MSAIGLVNAQVVDPNWLGGNGNWSTNSQWSNSTLPGNSQNAVINSNGLPSVVTLDVNATIAQLQVGATHSLVIANNRSLTLGGASGGITNDGTISLNASANLTQIILSGGNAFTFSGTGVLSLSNHSSNRIYGSTNTESLTNASGHTIQGSGSLGLGLLAISNAGLIQANQATALVIDPNATGFINTGTLRATSTATLRLENGTFTNTGGLIEAHDNSHVDISAATVTGGTLTSLGAGHFHLLNTPTLSGVAISSGSNIELGNAHHANLTGTIQNSGTIKLLSEGNSTDLLITSTTATLGGGGNVTLSANANNRIYGSVGTHTLINQDNVISGAGQIGVNQLTLDNRGTITANASGATLTIDPSATGAKNSGTMQAASGGILRVQGAAVDNAGGTILAQAGSKVQIDSSTVSSGTVSVASGGTLELDTSTLTSGTLTVAATALAKTTGGQSTLGGTVTNAASGEFQIGNNTSLRLQATGLFTNSGTISLNSAGNSTDLIMMGGDVTLSGTGTLSLSNFSTNRIYGVATSDRLINAAGHTIQGSGQLGLGLMGFTNHGTVIANQSNALVVNPSSSGATNTGTFRATNGATLNVTGGTFTNTGGTIEALTGSTVRFDSAVVAGGTLSSTGTGRLLNAANSSFSNLSLATGATFDVANATDATFTGTVANHGTVNLLSGGNSTDLIAGTGGLTLSGGGTIVLSNNANNRIYAVNGTTTLINLDNTIRGAGQLGANQLQLDNRGLIESHLAGATLTLDPSGSGFLNSGTLQALNGGILTLTSGTFDNTGGTIRAQAGSAVHLQSATVTSGTFEVGATGSVSLDSSTINGGTLNGAASGTITAAGGANTLGGAVVINAGTQLNISNNANLKLLATGTYAHNGAIALNSAGNLSDLIISGGNVTLDGTGTVTLGNNANNRVYGLAAGDRLVLNSGITVSGAGQFGVGLMGVTNHGVIEATQPGNALILNPNSSGVANAGTLRATAGATLRLIDGSYNNAGGTITAQDGSRVQFESANVSGGTLSTAGTGRLVNASASTYSGVTLSHSSVFDLNNNTSATFTGTFANEGTVHLLSVGNLADFIAGTGGATLQGGGTIVLGNNSNNRIYGISGSTTLVNQNNTIRGVGQLGVNQLQLDNRGLIEASVATGTLTLDTSGTSAVNPNTGTLQAVNGGILRIESSAINNSGGTIHAATGSRVDLASSTITGGSLTTAGTGVIRTASGGSTLSGALTIASGAQLTIENNTSLTLLASGTYANSGTVSFASAGNLTDLIATGGDVTISGGGTLALGNNANNRIYGGGGADRLVNAGGTIRGSGQIGVGLLGLVNQGTVKADQGTALTIDPSAAGVTNTGNLRAESGATLRLTNGAFTNTNGIIAALGTGSVVEFNAATITNGTLTSDAGAVLRHTGGSTFHDITLSAGSSLQLLNNTGAHFGGTLFNHATVALTSAGNFTDFILGGNVTLEGGGTVSLGNNSNNRIYSDVTDSRLTNRNNTIEGSGQIGVGLMGLINQSTIKANQPTALIIDPSSAGVTNTGLLRADSGATLQLQNGAITNTGGTIEAFGAGSVVNFHSATVTHGLLRSSDGGVLRNAFSSTFTDVFLTSGATLQIPNNTSATFIGTITNGGVVNLLSAGNFTDVLVGPGGVTLVGGVVDLGGNVNNRIYSPSGTTTLINQSALIRGAGQVGVGLTRIDNRAVIDANLAGATLTLDPSASGAVNSGLLTSSNGGILRIRGGTYDNTGGSIIAGTGSRVDLDSAVITGGFIGGSTIRNTVASSLSALNIGTGASVEILNNTQLTLTGAIGNFGTIRLQSAGNFTDLFIGTGGTTLNGHGVIELSNNSTNRIYATTGATVLNNVNNTIRGSGQLGSGQLTLGNSGTIEANQSVPLTVDLTNSVTFTNQGTLRAGNGATLAFNDPLTNAAAIAVQSGSAFTTTGALTQTAGSTSLQGGTLSAASTALQGGLLQGSGTINGAVTSGGTIAPGASGLAAGIGTLTFNHTLTLSPTSLLQLEIGGASSADRIIAPNAFLQGALAVSFANGFQAGVQPGDTFTLLSTVSTSGLTGTFNGLAQGARFLTADGFGTFQINYSGNALLISNFVAVPEPSTYALIGFGVVVIFVAHRRRRS